MVQGKVSWWGWVALMALGLATIASAADQIRLKDGREVSGTVLQRDSEQVIVGIPRADVVSVNGETLPPPIAPGVAAPAFTAADLSGTTHTLESYRGSPVLLQFWATWCPHCRADMPMMQQVYDRYGKQGLHVLTVSIDSDRSALEQFVKRERLPYPVIDAVTQTGLAEQYEADGVPAYVLIDGEGKIVQIWRGELGRRMDELDRALARLLPHTSA